MTATQTMILFETGNDLSDDFMKVCYRRMKSDSFDVYEMIGNSKVSIKHRARRGPSELIKEDPINGNTYVAGIAYDSFDVWVNVQDADSSIGRPGCSKCVAEDVRTFDDAISIAQEYI
jgi:hypothetical protein